VTDRAHPADSFLPLLPRGTPAELIRIIKDAARDALAKHGLGAFAASRETAIAHEVGHAIVGTHEGFTILHVTISAQSVPILGYQWGGRCMESGKTWTSGPDTTADNDLRRARFIVAGLAGEAATGLHKPGSSLDELALSQIVAANGAAKLADDPALQSDAAYSAFAQRLWHEQVWRVVIAVLQHNGEPFQQLAELLHRHGRVQGAKLRMVLDQVRRIAP
jgi:hypothetical protein